MATTDDVAFLLTALDDPTLLAALSSLVPPEHVEPAHRTLSQARRWKRRRKVEVKHLRWAGGYVRTFAAEVPAPSGAATVWARVASDDEGYLWVRFYPADPAALVSDRLRLPADVMARLSRITDVEHLSERDAGPDGAITGSGYRLVDPWEAESCDEPDLPVDFLATHRAALLDLLDPDEDFVWGGVGRAVTDLVVNESEDGPFTAATLRDIATCWHWVPGLGPDLTAPGDAAVPDPAGRHLDTWLAPVADVHYIPHLHGTAFGLEVSTWMFGDREHTTIVVGRDPSTGAIGAAYTAVV